MQPSQMAIEREFEALRDIKRRSTSQGGPGSPILDPDLPAQPSPMAPPLSPKARRSVDSATSPPRGQEEDTSSGESGSADDPFHLFWVPAHLHPELAPSEFRAFLKEHARTPSDGDGSATPMLDRSNSSASLGRKTSMLSRQYKPRANDGVEEERVVPMRRNKSIYGKEGPQLTIGDLQKLEELADEASKSDDPTKLRRVLRRSMSLNVAPSFLDQMDDVPDTTDEADAPIIVPPPGKILQRTARTKIRKPNLSGDGGGHRFPASRKKPTGRAASIDNTASPTDGSSSGHGEIEPFSIPPPPSRRLHDEPEELYDNRRMTYTEESSIYDAYADILEDERPPSPKPTPSPARVIVESPPPVPPVPPIPDVLPHQQPPPLAQPAPILHQPTPQRHLSPAIQQQQAPPQPSRTPSPDAASAPSSLEIQRPDSRSSVTSEAPSYQSSSSMSMDKRKEKDKKSLWRKVGGGDKGSKKNGKEQPKEREREKDGGFFGSLFGGGKRKQEDQPPSNIGGGAGPATAAALLGASKSSKAYSPSISPQLGNPYARYPIHVERAVYRLSHIKLANPRRPLYEQVLISNLMFWYLGVINKSHQGPGQSQNQNQSQKSQGQTGGQSQDGAQTPPVTSSEKEHMEREQREQQEKEERERVERERIEKERADRERAEAQREKEQRREPRRGTLTKPAPGTPASTGRRAEMPVKGPQYHLQSQVIEQEYGSGPNPVPVARTSSAPPPSGSASQGYNGGHSHRPHLIQPAAQQQHQQQQQYQHQQHQPRQQQTAYAQPNGNQNYYYARSGSLDMGSSSPQAGPPPGAMQTHPPQQTNEQLWMAMQSNSSNTGWGSSPSSNSYPQGVDYNQQPQRSTRTPPPTHYSSNGEWGRGMDGGGGGVKVPARSLSANAVSPVPSPAHHGQQNGVLKKKVASVSAVSPDRHQWSGDPNEEEDVPLAVWQQRRK
ncbi:hypothetical protein M0805_006682 [Coniferiporia weirii]|nr:hypothetical protein M0805_006682 [Coniferiporia weirii]